MTDHLYKITGMNCGGCVSRVEKAIKDVKGVKEAQVNLADESAMVKGGYDSHELQLAVAKAGYTAKPMAEVDVDNSEHKKKALTLFVKAIPAGVLGALLMANMHAASAEGVMGISWYIMNWLVLAIMLISGGHIYKAALKSVKNMQADMYTLIGLGTSMAWAYSCVVLYAPEFIAADARHYYYEAALFILAFINIGQGMEAYAKGKASSAVAKLLALTPDYVIRLRQGEEEKIPLSEVEVGDLLKIRPGENIPVDGTVTEGHSAVSEAMLTGEPVMIAKKVDSEVVAGTHNGQGSFVMRADKVGEDTVLSKVVEMVREAQSTKPAIAQLVDRIAGVFALIVLGIAVATAAAWYLYGPEPQMAYAFTVAMTVLVIACPCALGLATPVSIMVGVSRAARGGVLMPRGQALQQLGLADVIAFDKTGTLTMGTPRVVETISTEGTDIDRVLQIAASLATLSEHPLSNAIANEAKHREMKFLKATAFENTPGQGVKAKLGGKPCFVGSKAYIKAQKIDVDAFDAQVNPMLEQGKTVVYVAREKQTIGVIALNDDLRKEAKQAVKALRKMGKEVVMLTGDNERAAAYMAKQASIEVVHAGLSPDAKLEKIRAFQSEGKSVAMVGDGINDAPSLAQANVGVSLATGSDIAITSADVIIATNNLQRLPFAVRISSSTMRNIKQNLFWAFAYNTTALPVAAGLLYPITGQLLPPWVAGAAMAASSLTVVLNALRLNWVKA